jgi:hypothetical protein
MPTVGSFAAPDLFQRRERGLRRVSATTRWTAAAAAAGVLVLGAGYAHALPNTAEATAGNVQHPPQTDGLQPPPQIPAPAYQPAQSTTGAS